MTAYEFELAYSLDDANKLGKEGWYIASSHCSNNGSHVFVMERGIRPDWSKTLTAFHDATSYMKGSK